MLYFEEEKALREEMFVLTKELKETRNWDDLFNCEKEQYQQNLNILIDIYNYERNKIPKKKLRGHKKNMVLDSALNYVINDNDNKCTHLCEIYTTEKWKRVLYSRILMKHFNLKIKNSLYGKYSLRGCSLDSDYSDSE